jgi:hypothetical protein
MRRIIVSLAAAAIVAGLGLSTATPASAQQGWGYHGYDGWRAHDWQEQEWRRHMWWRAHHYYYYQPGGYSGWYR